MTAMYSIAQVERATGIPKDLLRMWERRYGFPQPTRDEQGDRVYADADIKKLALIRRLMEQGKRPGKLVGLSVVALQDLHSQCMTKEAERLHELVSLLKQSDFQEIRAWLDARLQSQGLRRFVCETVPQLNNIVGDAWEDDRLGVHDEHLYTEQLNNLLRTSIAALPAPAPGALRYLLTTVAGEQHGLGLLMVEAVLRQEGCAVISLGTETPLDDIVRAALAHQADVVALSFSIAFAPKQAFADLAHLRKQLPSSIALWGGGAALQNVTLPTGVIFMSSIEEVAIAARGGLSALGYS